MAKWMVMRRASRFVRRAHAGLLLGGLALTGGCFDEIIHRPGATDGEATTSTSGAETEDTEDTATTTATTTGSASDDADTTGDSGAATTSGGTTGDETTGDAGDIGHLCAAATHLCDGESWSVDPCDDCAELTPLAACTLAALGGSAGGVVTVERCDGDCVRDHYVLRDGALDVLVESARLDGDGVELEILERAMCQRAAPEFFASCTSDYVEATCADPTAWLGECSPVDLDACPFAAP